MSVNESKWRTREVAENFLKGVRGAVPAAGLQLEVVDHILNGWIPGSRRILDLGCGDGIIGRYLQGKNPDTVVVFADFWEPMLDAARKKLGDDGGGTLVKADFSTPSWIEEVGGGPFDAVVTGFAIHHQSDIRKRELYGEIYGLLENGGVFLNLEHVSSETAEVEKLFDGYFIDSLHRFHRSLGSERSREEIGHEYYHRPDKSENVLAPVSTQCDWLRGIGFVDVDCFFKLFELALFGGRKPGARGA